MITLHNLKLHKQISYRKSITTKEYNLEIIIIKMQKYNKIIKC